jgi:hypothetical protein
LVWVYCGAQPQTFGLSLQWCSVPNIWIEFTMVLSSKHLDWVYNGAWFQTFGLRLQWCSAPNNWIGFSVVFGLKHLDWVDSGVQSKNIWIGLTVVLSPKHLFWVYSGAQPQIFGLVFKCSGFRLCRFHFVLNISNTTNQDS